MKHVLLVAYLFPPVGGGGVQRAVKLAKYLTSHDVRVSVLTVANPRHATLDHSLMDQLPDEVQVYRAEERKLLPVPKAPSQNAAVSEKETAPQRPSFKQRLFQRLKPHLVKGKEWLLVPDDQILWYRGAVEQGKAIVKDEGVDVVLSTSGPYTNHLVGRALKAKTGIPWIADFRDPWTQNMHRPSMRWRLNREEKMEAAVMKEADLITTVTPTFRANFVKKYPFIDEKLHLIYNGFDPADYRDLAPLKRDENAFTVLYTGIFYKERNPRLFLKAVCELIGEGKLDRDLLSLEFAGVFDYPGYTENQDAVRAYGLGDVVHQWGNLKHGDVLGRMKGADLLLLVGDTSEDAGAYIPGKLYEYMAVNRPILALSVDGESATIVRDHHLGDVVHPFDLEGMKASVLSSYESWKSGTEPRAAHGDETRRYRRDEQAKAFAGLIHDVT